MAKNSIGSRRSAVEIIFDILSVCSDGGANKTAIMYRSNLSHDQLVRYLSYLADQELLEMHQRRFRLNDKGQEMLDEVSQVIELLRGLRGAEEDMDDAAWRGTALAGARS